MPRKETKQPTLTVLVKKHEWEEWKFTGRTLICCNFCGIVKKRDGSNADNPCKGKVSVTLR